MYISQSLLTFIVLQSRGKDPTSVQRFGSKPTVNLLIARRLGAFHGFRANVVSISLFHLSNGDTASALGENGESTNRQGNRNFLVAWNGSRDNGRAELALHVHDGASVIFTARSAASAWKAGGRRLAAELQVKAAKASLSGASKAVSILVVSAVTASNGTAKAAISW